MLDTVPFVLASNLLVFALIARWYVWPALMKASPKEAMTILLLPHAMRFIGLLFLSEGATKQALPAEFATSAAWGDVTAATLALFALGAVRLGAWQSFSIAGVAHGFGLIDLLTAVGLGVVYSAPTGMGATIWIPAVIVPALLVTHGLAFALLLRCHCRKKNERIEGSTATTAATAATVV